MGRVHRSGHYTCAVQMEVHQHGPWKILGIAYSTDCAPPLPTRPVDVDGLVSWAGPEKRLHPSPLQFLSQTPKPSRTLRLSHRDPGRWGLCAVPMRRVDEWTRASQSFIIHHHPLLRAFFNLPKAPAVSSRIPIIFFC
mmetsp:Transcript_7644/g.11531  ORF Transcript_7644/g.11531 Transcript_7644/m.11531 type:complete len:138 (-) Transcript_7644:10-423(-)